MKLDTLRPLRATTLAVAIASLLGVTFLAAPASWAQSEPQTTRSGGNVTLNFNNAEIEAVARAMASITGRDVVVDPRVKGTITLTTERPVTPAAALNRFLAALRLMGYSMVQSEGMYKVVPEADAKLQSSTVTPPDATGQNVIGNQITTQIFRLDHASASNLVPVLRPLIDPNNTINVDPGNNALIITDYADNLRRIARIISSVDVADTTGIEVIPLQHAVASDLAPLLLRLVDASGVPAAGTPGGTPFKTTLIAEPRSNAIIVRAGNAARLALVKSLVQQLDRDTDNGAAGNIHVVYLKNAEAAKLAVTLRAALAGEARTAGTTVAGTSAAAAAGSAAAASTGGQIQADEATNSLIITAPEPQYRQLRAVIDKLDIRRAQVFVESLIAEVSEDKAGEFGIQWQGAFGQNGDANIGIMGTNFGTGGNNIINLAVQGVNGTVTPGRGLNIGALNRNSGIYVLGFLARFLEESGSGNVLSTPNLLTLDNEEAKIVIGQNVPFVTGQFTSTGSATNTVNPFQTIERKDVGLTLRVKPQISENGTIKLSIYQEVSSVLASTLNAVNGPTTNKRTIESNVVVRDGSVVVLGGLLQDEYSNNQEKVPGLGDVPILGNLFRSEGRSRRKMNLMVFLRPVIVRDGAATDQLSLNRYDMMRAATLQAQPTQSYVVPINEAPTLPPAPARGSSADMLTTPLLAPSLPAAPAMPAAPGAPAPAPSAPKAPEAGTSDQPSPGGTTQ